MRRGYIYIYGSIFHQILNNVTFFLPPQKWFLISHPGSENPDSPLVSSTQDPAHTQGEAKSDWRIQVFRPRLPTPSRSRLLWQGGWSTKRVRRRWEWMYICDQQTSANVWQTDHHSVSQEQPKSSSSEHEQLLSDYQTHCVVPVLCVGLLSVMGSSSWW